MNDRLVIDPPRVWRSLSGACLVAILFVPAIAMAQYEYDPSAPHELDNAGIRFFGSVKDEKGTLVEGATIILDSDRFSLVFTTDQLGRFQTTVPLGTPPESVKARCAKPGYTTVRVTKRPGPAGVKPVMQINCLLRSKGAR